MKQKNIVIIGAGLIGLSTARALAALHPDAKICIVEKASCIAKEQSGHNSGVIHSGIYYKPDSLKAKNCVKGVALLEKYCEENEIPINRCGKVIIATDNEQVTRLNTLYERGLANGVLGIQKIGKEELKEIEPHAAGLQAVYCPNTSIVDYTLVAKSYLSDFQNLGGSIFFDSPVIGFKKDAVLTTKNSFPADFVINVAGAFSDTIAQLAGCKKYPGKILPFRGEYYKLRKEKEHLVNGLIYPTPDPRFPFLGVHLTRMIREGVEAGPNAVLALSKQGYDWKTIDPKEVMNLIFYKGTWKMASKYWKEGAKEVWRSLSKKAFLHSLQQLMPSLTEQDLIPGGSGVRAQLVKPNGMLHDDFCIEQSDRFLHVLNAPSPGATASLAIGETLAHIAHESYQK